jgi:Sulfotransferase domain
MRPRVFGIGLNKTATTTLAEALTILGFEPLHWGGQEAHEAVLGAFEAGEPLLSRLDARYDAFLDIGVLSRRFVLLDAQYPGSRFLLTVRPVDDWIDSRRRHVLTNQERKAAGEYDGTFLEVDEPKWRAEWELHLERVHGYFGDRTDLLEIDVTADPTWARLCRFLDRPEPAVPFPWLNRGAG